MTEKDKGGKRILYIEDDPDISKLVAQVLELEGFEVLAARRGSRGVELLYESFPHLVLLDIVMPVMSGFKVLETIHSKSGLREIPVICVSAMVDLPQVQKAFSLGAAGYVFKPIDFSFLLALINFYISKGGYARRAPFLLEHQAVVEAAELAGEKVDSLEKMDLVMAVYRLGKSNFHRRELGRFLLLGHPDLGEELRELQECGAIFPLPEEGNFGVKQSSELILRGPKLEKIVSNHLLFQAFINGIHTGVIAYGFAHGRFDRT